MGLTLPLSLLILHFLGDFILQSNWMALGKSKSWYPLLIHTLVYSACFLPFGLLFWAITFVTHTATDFFTSRWTSKLWFIPLEPITDYVKDVEHDCPGPKWSTHFASIDARKRHWFFVAIGADQLIHFTTLALTYRLL